MACPAERGRVTRGGSQSNSESKSKSSDKVRSAGFGPKPPASTHRCGRDHAQSSCGQCRKDRSRSCSVMRAARGAVDASPLRSDPVQRLRHALTAAALPLLMKAEVAAPLALRTVSMPSTYLSRPSTRATLFLHAQGRTPQHSGHRKAIWPGSGEMRSSHSSFTPDVNPRQHLARGHPSWHNQALLERGNCNATAAR
jgi:hypothetical protein